MARHEAPRGVPAQGGSRPAAPAGCDLSAPTWRPHQVDRCPRQPTGVLAPQSGSASGSRRAGAESAARAARSSGRLDDAQNVVTPESACAVSPESRPTVQERLFGRLVDLLVRPPETCCPQRRRWVMRQASAYSRERRAAHKPPELPRVSAARSRSPSRRTARSAECHRRSC
jgi:hypothetical protein